MPLMPDADLVLEGGGMKGIGLAGAVTALLRAGYTFQRVAGTSAGAIVGALLAAGIGERGLTDAMTRLRYDRVPDRGPPKLPILSEGFSLLHSAGAYEGRYIHGFVRDELERLGVRTFADLRRTDGGDDANLPPEPLPARRHGDRRHPRAAAAAAVGLRAAGPRPRRAARRRRGARVDLDPVVLRSGDRAPWRDG